jgi:hypothetical protein
VVPDKEDNSVFTFHPTDDGLHAVHTDGRTIARIDTRVLGENNDPRLKVPEKTVTPIPKDKWSIHFSGARFTPAEVKAFIDELAVVDETLERLAIRKG